MSISIHEMIAVGCIVEFSGKVISLITFPVFANGWMIIMIIIFLFDL